MISGPDLPLYSLEIDNVLLWFSDPDSKNKVLHEFSRGVIKARWDDYQQKKTELGENFETEYFGEAKSKRKRRLSFLGMVLTVYKNRNILLRYTFAGDGQGRNWYGRMLWRSGHVHARRAWHECGILDMDPARDWQRPGGIDKVP